MIRGVFPALTALVLAVGAAQAALPLTPGRIAASIRQRGPEATIAALAKADQWDQVADRIGSGDGRWIALAPQLAPGSDAGSAEDLGISLAYALPKNPRAVLAVLDPANGHVIGADRVCSIPFIEDTVRDRPAYRRRALRAVGGVTDPALGRARAACVAELKEAS